MSVPLTTSWRITELDGIPRMTGLNVILTVDTAAPVVIGAIEDAAVRNGITLERIEEEPDGSA